MLERVLLEKNVVVTIKSKQMVDGQQESIELITAGKFYKNEDEYTVVYDETEISGMKGTTTTVNIRNGEVNLIRTGTTNARLGFKKGVKDISLYSTPYGILELAINPSLIDINIDDSGGEVKMSYSLEAEGLQTSINDLFIKIQESQ